MNLEELIRDVPDFPKAGIVFKDITPLLANSEALVYCADRLAEQCPTGVKIDKVIGIEARGFMLGCMIAERLAAGFIPVRKKGKLPSEVISKSYGLEYGEDILEIHKDAIKPGDNILIHDDVLATGGTANAVCQLVTELGGNIVQCNFIMELGFLNGKEKLNCNVASLLSY
ncbi:adenine phosphoribosyltransferase [Aquimarina sp. MMG015]|uniref:adenine phosphoribosyltransferase n=1 Tax=Aquimarina TaxID=290174 RepID=UPI00042625B3|nr:MULTISPECIES: adenine phosphoribosyltransferase [Aquimarina]AXT56331.1 adenine phosphoribosyltransferase [Aquimarina sp. AD1]MBQ4803563.1 adenine phosphoribosyltransferase [Aquimarina sp. MMG015]RKN05587.1 adenine phosphoribosyltransferase [Aquimarina sp. AD1]